MKKRKADQIKKAIATTQKKIKEKFGHDLSNVRQVTIHKGQTEDQDKDVIKVVATTSNPIKRYYFDEDWKLKFYWESLDMSKESVDARYLENNAVNLFKDHDSHKVDQSMGKVFNYDVNDEKERLEMDVRLQTVDEEGQIFRDKVKQGFLTNFSIGYRIDYDFAEFEERDDGDWLIAKKWMPLELSNVGVPADESAQLLQCRSLDNFEKNICDSKNKIDIVKSKGEIVKNKNEKVKEEIKQPAIAPAKHSVDTRTEDILALAEKYEIPVARASEFIKSGKPVAEIKTDILLEKIEKQNVEKKPVNDTVVVGSNRNEEGLKKFMGVEFGSVLFKKDREKVDGFTRNSMVNPASFLGLVRDYMGLVGKPVGFDNAAMVRDAMHTTDFPTLLGDNIHRELYSVFAAAAAASHGPLIKEVTIPDYRKKDFATIGTGRSAQKLEEGGPVSYDAVLESGESITISRYSDGRKLTHEMMVNDDVMLMNEILMSLPVGLNLTDSALFWEEYNSGTMKNSRTFFNSTDGNAVASTDLTNTGLGKAYSYLKTRSIHPSDRKKVANRNKNMYLQMSLDTIVVHPDLAPTAKTLVRDISADTAANVNIFADEIKNIIISPYVSSTKWSAHANKMVLASFICAKLANLPMFEIDSEWDFDTSSYKVKGELRVGYKGLDRRAGVQYTTA